MTDHHHRLAPGRRRFTTRLATGLAALGAGAALAPAGLRAQTAWPTKPVKLVVPNAPGGAIDILARLFQAQLANTWSQPIIVEYKPGAGTALGTDYVAKADPDGHTIGIVVTSHVINPALRKLPFDTTKDLSGVTLAAVSNVLISATPGLPANTLAEVIALAKKQPGKLSYASPGSGSSMHLAMELLKQIAGIDVLHVPFKGSGPAYPEVMSGRIELLVDPLFSSLPHLKSGRLKPIAVTGAQRSPIAPEIAPVAETIPNFNVLSIFGIVVPSKTPRELVARINADMTKALAAPEMRQKMADMGLEPASTTPEKFDEMIRTEIERWGRVVKTANITAD